MRKPTLVRSSDGLTRKCNQPPSCSKRAQSHGHRTRSRCKHSVRQGQSTLSRGKKRVRAAAATAVAVMTLALAACGGPGAKAGGGASDKEAASSPLTQASEPVQAVYKASCQSCHGVDLAGRAGPVTNLQRVGGRLTQQQIAAQIASGGGNMPGFGAKLKPEDIAALAAWLAAVK